MFYRLGDFSSKFVLLGKCIRINRGVLRFFLFDSFFERTSSCLYKLDHLLITGTETRILSWNHKPPSEFRSHCTQLFYVVSPVGFQMFFTYSSSLAQAWSNQKPPVCPQMSCPFHCSVAILSSVFWFTGLILRLFVFKIKMFKLLLLKNLI